MSVRRLFRSLRFRMCAFLALLFLGVAALMLWWNLASVNILRDEVCSAARDVLTLSRRQLDNALASASASLASISYLNTDMAAIESGTPDTTDFHTAMERVKRQFQNAAYASMTDGFFYYDPARKLYFANDNDIHNPVRKAFERMDAQQIRQRLGAWFALREEAILVRIVNAGDRSFIGTCVGVEKALATVSDDRLAGSRTLLLDGEGAFLSADAPDLRLSARERSQSEDYAFVEIDRERFLAVTERVGFGDFFLVTLIPDASISSRISTLSSAILWAGVSAFLIFSFGALLIRHWILLPTRRLTRAIQALEAGDFTATLPLPSYEEFDAVYRAFNEATETIKRLKIDMYEERLRRQKIRMQYLQTQIAPHFLINCLNTVYQLTDARETELAHVFLQALSRHLRYTLSAGETVELGEELLHVENYATLSRVRYPGGIELFIDCADALREAAVCPLMILGFVEKTLTAYIMEQRVRRAKELLRGSDRSVRDVALRCGFQNIPISPNSSKGARARRRRRSGNRRKPDSHVRAARKLNEEHAAMLARVLNCHVPCIDNFRFICAIPRHHEHPLARATEAIIV